jgi:hypothetical protein
MRAALLCIIAAAFISPDAVAQAPKIKFHGLSRPEKWWVVTHLCVAKKAQRITREAIAVSMEIKNNGQLDSRWEGGKVDAFRHSYWMARLSQEMCWRKAEKLGKAHEKGNHLKFKQGLYEPGLQDSAACSMDMHNNKAGLAAGCDNKALSKDELRELLFKKIATGEMLMLRQDSSGNWLDCDGRIIDPSSFGTWETPRCLVKTH